MANSVSDEVNSDKDRNWFTALLEYTVRPETDDAEVEGSELELLEAAFRNERYHGLAEMAVQYPEVTSANVDLLQKQVDEIYPKAHELWTLLKQKRHFLENSLIKEAEEYSTHMRETREDLLVVEATIDILDRIKTARSVLVDALAALDVGDFIGAVAHFKNADDELSKFSPNESQNIIIITELARRLEDAYSKLHVTLEAAWNRLMRLSWSSDVITISLADRSKLNNIVVAANKLGLLDRLCRSFCEEMLEKVVMPLFDAMGVPTLREERLPNNGERLIIQSLPDSASESNSIQEVLSRTYTNFEILGRALEKVLLYMVGMPNDKSPDDSIASASSVLRDSVSQVLAVPLMSELVVEKCLRSLQQPRNTAAVVDAGISLPDDWTASKHRLQTSLQNLYNVFSRFSIPCGGDVAPDINALTSFVERAAIQNTCEVFVQRARRAVTDPTLFRNGKTVHIVPDDDADGEALVKHMLSTVQFAATIINESLALPTTASYTTKVKQTRRVVGSRTAAATQASGGERMQTSAALHELSLIVDDVLVACGQADSGDVILPYVRAVRDVYATYLDFSSEMTLKVQQTVSDSSRINTVPALTFCSCAIYPQLISEAKSKVEEVLRWNDRAVVAGQMPDTSVWHSVFDNSPDLLPRARAFAESFAHTMLLDAVNAILTSRSSGSVLPNVGGDAKTRASEKLMKAASWLKQQPGAHALTTAASSLAAVSNVGGQQQYELHALVDGARLSDVYDHIEALKREWFGIMPTRVALFSLSAIVDIVLGKLGAIVLRQNDLSADEATGLAQNFKLLSRKLMVLYKSDGETPTRHCMRWEWFNELTTVLEASMADIDERWSEGQGPLALHFSAAQVVLLVRALFQNNDRRQRLLYKLEHAVVEHS